MKKIYTLLFLSLLLPLSCFAIEQGYTVLDEATGTLTFKYGEKPNGDNLFDTDNTGYGPAWIKNGTADKIKHIVFDSSFADAKPITMRYWFANCVNLVDITGMQYLNTSYATNMHRMFMNCKQLTDLDLKSFDTKNVTDMGYMFSYCLSLKSLDFSSFDTHSVKTMKNMFIGCKELTKLDLSRFNTSNVEDMDQMFEGCTNLQELTLSSFDTRKVKSMWSLFKDCSSLNYLDLSSFKTNEVVYMRAMFENCSSLESLDLSTFNTEHVEDMYYMFSQCERIKRINLSSFNTCNVKDMKCMFQFCRNLEELDLRGFDTRKVESLNWIFRDCNNLSSIKFGKDFCSPQVDEDSKFWGCRSITSITFMGDVPQLSSQFFEQIGDPNLELPACTLYVPEQYYDNYASNFSNGWFYKGFFTLKAYKLDDSNENDDSFPEFVIGNKLIKSITVSNEKGNVQWQCDMNYNDNGLITECMVAQEGKTKKYSYTYNSNKIKISPSDEDNIYYYSFSDGKLSKGNITLNKDEVSIEEKYYYDDNNHLSTVSSSYKRGNKTWTDGVEVMWTNDNLSSWTVFSEGLSGKKIELISNFTNNTLKSEPIIHALFGLGKGDELNINVLIERIAIYPFIGHLPLNLFSEVKVTDMLEDNLKYTFYYNYEMDSNGIIIKVIINNTIYYLEWEDLTTAVKKTQVTKELSKKDLYNLQGRKVQTTTSNINDIPTGIYIVDGRKILINKNR